MANTANVVWYSAEGDYFSAVCCAVGVFGGGFALLGKVGTASCGLMQFLRFGTAVLSIGIGGYDMYQIGKSNYERALRGEPLTIGSVASDLARIGMDSVSIAGGIKLAIEPIPYCFVAGTLVATSEGQVAIEQIKPGDMVLAENPETGEVEYKEVLETYENETEELIHVHVNGEDIVTTPSHPFYVNQFGWTRAAQLRAGDVLVLSNGEYVVVEFIQHEILEEPVKVYNFEVEGFHTYFVGESSVLVHNMCVAKGTLASNDVFEVDPKQVNFSQRTVSGNVETYTQDMINGNWTWNDNNTIRVMERDGQLVTYDNRRLMAAQNAGLDTIPVKIVQGTDAFPDSTTGRTWDDAFVRRFNDKRNKKAGGVVPNTGLSQQPSIATATGGGK